MSFLPFTLNSITIYCFNQRGCAIDISDGAQESTKTLVI
jgi:hypothetical protein